MANDLRVVLGLDYSQYQKGMQSSIAMNAQFGASAKSMAAQIKAAQTNIRNANLHAPGNAGFDSQQRVIRRQSVADLATQQAVTRQLVAEYNDSSLQATRAAASTQKLKQEVISLATENRQLAGSLSSTTSQKLALAATTQRLTGTVLSLRAANAQGTAALNSSKVSALSLEHAYQEVISAAIQSRLQTRNLANTQQALNQALKAGAITQEEYAAGMARATAATGAKAVSAGRAQMAISQMIYAVDDAATVYGTAGLAGSVRAASNNLTMMAGLMGGPYALGAAVAVAATVQLGLAFAGLEKDTKEAKEQVDRVTSAIRHQLKAIEDLINLRDRLKKAAANGGPIVIREELKENAKQVQTKLAQLALINAEIARRDKSLSVIDEANAKRRKSLEDKLRSKGDSLAVPLLVPVQGLIDSFTKVDRGVERARISAELLENEKERTDLIREQKKLLNERAVIEEHLAETLRVGRINIAAQMEESWQGIRKAAEDIHNRFMESNREAAVTLAKRHTETRNAINDHFEDRFLGRSGLSSKRREIASNIQSQLRDIDSMQGTPEEKRKLKDRARKMAAMDLANESSEGATTGPSGFEKGGKEAAEIMRRAMLSQHSQKDKSEHYLQIIQEEIKKLNQTAEKERAAVEKMVKNTPTPIKLTP